MRSKSILYFCCIIELLAQSHIFAQSEWSFYPLSLGNFWRYQISFNGGIWGYNRETIVDSLMIEGQWFWEKRMVEYTGGENSIFLRQQDSTYIKERAGLGQYAQLRCMYKIDAIVGESWLVEISPDDSSRKVLGRLDSTYQVEIFGQVRESKLYRFQSKSNDELQAEWFILLTKGLGLTTFRGGNGGVDFQDMDLVGAIIDGVEFGDPVSVNEYTKDLSTPKVFFINYPNPFTTTTTIEVDLHGFATKQVVQIVIYNLTGQRVRTIYNDVLPTGRRFRTNWDGRDDFTQRVNSGMYFLQMRTGNLVQTKRTLVLK